MELVLDMRTHVTHRVLHGVGEREAGSERARFMCRSQLTPGGSWILRGGGGPRARRPAITITLVFKTDRLVNRARIFV